MFPAQPDHKSLATALEHFLCPGGKLRLSPYVEATQCQMLFGKRPDPTSHYASVREIIARPEHQATLHAVAEAFLQDPDASRFERYEQRAYLDLYLTHYLSANVGKLQIVLLDLLRAGRLPAELHLID